MQTLLHLSKRNKPSLFFVSIGIECFESLLQTLGQLLYFPVQQYSKCFFVGLGIGDVSVFVSVEKYLDGVDTKRNEIIPCDFAVRVFVS